MPLHSSPRVGLVQQDLNLSSSVHSASSFLSPVSKRAAAAAACNPTPSPLTAAAATLPLPCSPTEEALAHSPSVSLVRRSPGSSTGASPSRRVFASPLRFRHTPPPAPLETIELPPKSPRMKPIRLDMQMEEEVASEKFALCAAAQALLAEAKEDEETPATTQAENSQTADQETYEELLPEDVHNMTTEEEAAQEELDSQRCDEELPESFDAELPAPLRSLDQLETDQAVVVSEGSTDEDSQLLATDLEQPLELEHTIEEDAAEELEQQEQEQQSTEDAPCQSPNCLALLDLSENLSLEVTELTNRYAALQEEGARLYKQYEIKCAMVKATKAHNQAQHEHIVAQTSEHDTLRHEYHELYCAYQELETLYNAQIAAEQDQEQVACLTSQLADADARDIEAQKTIDQCREEAREKDRRIAELEAAANQPREESLPTKQQADAATQSSAPIPPVVDHSAAVAALEASLADLRTAHAAEIVDAERELTDLTRSLQGKTAAMTRVEAELDQAQQQLEAMTQQVATFAAEKATFDRQHQERSDQLASFRVEVEEVHRQVEDLQSTVQLRDDQLAALQVEADMVSPLRQTIETMQAAARQQETELTTAHTQLADLRQARQSQQQSHAAALAAAVAQSELSLALAADKSADLERSLDSATLLAAELDQALQAERNTVATLRTQAEQIPALTATVAVLRSDLATTQTRLSQQSALVASLESQLREQLAQHAYDLKCSSSVAEELESDLRARREEVEAAGRKARDQRKKADEMRETIVTLQARVSELESTAASRALPAVASSRPSAATLAEFERLESESMSLRSQNATLQGRLQAVEAMRTTEVAGLKSRLAIAAEEANLLRRGGGGLAQQRQAEAEAATATARASLHEVQAQLAVASSEVARLTSDKEQLLQQVELLMESTGGATTSGSLDGDAVAAYEARLQQLQNQNADFKAYVQRYKASGDAKMHTLATQLHTLTTHASGLCAALVAQGVVKRENAQVYALCKQIAAAIQPTASAAPTIK